MSKPIKLQKDRLGNPYYPATTTDAVVHPIKKKSLTDIIDEGFIEDGTITMSKLSDDVKSELNKIPTNYITSLLLDNALSTYSKDNHTHDLYLEQQDINSKQDLLVSGTTIKTINGESILGSGDIQILPGNDVDLSGYYSKVEINNTVNQINSRIDGIQIPDISNKQDKILDLDDIREGATKGATSLLKVPDEYITESELNSKGYLTQHQQIKTINNQSLLGSGNITIEGGKDVDLTNYYTKSDIDSKGYITNIPSEYVTDSELNAKGYLTQHQDITGKQDKISDLETIRSNASTALANVKTEKERATAEETSIRNSIPSKVSQLENDSNFINQLKTIMGLSLVGSGDITLGASVEAAVNSVKFKGIVNVWDDFTAYKQLHSELQVGEAFFCLPSLTNDVMGCLPHKTSWKDLSIPTTLSSNVEDVQKYISECTGDEPNFSPINVFGARAVFPSKVFKLETGSTTEKLLAMSEVKSLGYYPMPFSLNEDRWKSLSFREGDLICLVKVNYNIIAGLEVPVVLSFVWSFGSSSASKVASYNSLYHSFAPSASLCVKTGIYPWVTLNVPKNNNAYTLFVNRSTDRDDQGFYSVRQAAYGRTGDPEIYERMVFTKLDYINYLMPNYSSSQSSLSASTQITADTKPGDYLCVAHYNSSKTLEWWDMHLLDNLLADGSVTQDDSGVITLTKAFTDTVSGRVSLAIVSSMLPGPEGRLYPITCRSTKVNGTAVTLDNLSILAEIVDAPDTPWKMTSATDDMIKSGENIFTSRWGGDANWCLDSGIYPWVTGNVPVGNNGAFTLVVHKTAHPDGGGFYTIEQTAYGRQGEEQLYVYKRILFYKPATPGTDELDILENAFTWHKVNVENSGCLHVNTENGILKHIKIGYEPGVDVNSVASQPGTHYCIVDDGGIKSVGCASVEVINNWDNTSNVNITITSTHNGITTTYIASGEAINRPEIINTPTFNNVSTWATTNTRSDYIDKTAIIPNVTSNRTNPEYLTQVEFINKHGFNPASYTLQNDKFTAMTEIGVVQTPTYVTGYGLCEIELLTKELEEETKYALVLSFEKLNIKTSNEIATGVYTDALLKNMFGYTFSYLGDTIIARDKVYHASELTSYKKVYTRITESGVINVVSIVFENDKYTILTTAFNILS